MNTQSRRAGFALLALIVGVAVSTVIARGNGTTRTTVEARPAASPPTTPPDRPADAHSTLGCLRTATCTSVQVTRRENGALAVTKYDGSTTAPDAAQNPPALLPPSARQAIYRGLVCTNPRSCTTVGSYTATNGTQHGLIEQWNGSTWTEPTPPAPPGSTSSTLNAIACPSTTTCCAHGSPGVAVRGPEPIDGSRNPGAGGGRPQSRPVVARTGSLLLPANRAL
jgi:hypothetical protein